MSIWKTAIACSLATAVVAGQIGQATAAPLPTNVATMKAAAGGDVTPVYWRGRGFGWALGYGYRRYYRPYRSYYGYYRPYYGGYW